MCGDLFLLCNTSMKIVKGMQQGINAILNQGQTKRYFM